MKSANETDVLIIAAEASSSLYALRLLEVWKSQNKKINAFGIGSREMEAAGFEILGRSEDLAVVGIQEVLAHIKDIYGVFHKIVDVAKARKPKVALLLDYPDFNFRLAKKLHKLNIPVVYFISPQMWAWREGRVKLVQKYIDKMLVLFPFEVDFYRKHNVNVEFVGHPLLDEISASYFNDEQRKIHRGRFGFSEEKVVLGLMPGSRRSEIKHHLKTQILTAQKCYEQMGDKLAVALLGAPGLDMDWVKTQLPKHSLPLLIMQTEPMEMLRVVDVVLCASGTATLVTGLMRKPMVIMYIMNSLTAKMARLLVKSTRFFGMVNLVLNYEVAKERFQEEANPEQLANDLLPLLQNAEVRNQKSEELKKVSEALGASGAITRVANALDEYL